MVTLRHTRVRSHRERRPPPPVPETVWHWSVLRAEGGGTPVRYALDTALASDGPVARPRHVALLGAGMLFLIVAGMTTAAPLPVPVLFLALTTLGSSWLLGRSVHDRRVQEERALAAVADQARTRHHLHGHSHGGPGGHGGGGHGHGAGEWPHRPAPDRWQRDRSRRYARTRGRARRSAHRRTPSRGPGVWRDRSAHRGGGPRAGAR